MSAILATQYWSTAADESLPLSLDLAAGGSAALWLRSNRDRTDRSALGRFEKQFSTTELSEAFAILVSPEFAATANPGSVVPGEVVRKITLKRQGSGDLMRFVGESQPAPAAFAKAEGAFLHLVDKAMQSPTQAIAFRLDGVPGEIRQGSPIAFQLHIANPGEQAIRVPQPGGWQAANTVVGVKGLRSDIPLEKLGNAHSPSLNLGSGMVDTAGLPDLGKSHWVLEPGKAIVLRFKAPFRWEAGPYDVQMSYESDLMDAQGRGLGRFEWVSPKTRITVRKD